MRFHSFPPIFVDDTNRTYPRLVFVMTAGAVVLQNSLICLLSRAYLSYMMTRLYSHWFTLARRKNWNSIRIYRKGEGRKENRLLGVSDRSTYHVICKIWMEGVNKIGDAVMPSSRTHSSSDTIPNQLGKNIFLCNPVPRGKTLWETIYFLRERESVCVAMCDSARTNP